MHVEIQMALNFLISFLYNKLPRRRVNQFGEELEKALRHKFQGHWYLEKPYKGSAFRCLKTAPPLDPVFEIAAREAGVDLQDIQDNLPAELSIWVDPGEVSYRLGEKVPVKLLYTEGSDVSERRDGRERTFNPEAQCFRPIDSVSSQLAGLAMTGGSSGSSPQSPPAPSGPPAGPSSVSPSSPSGSSPNGTAPGTFKPTPGSPVGNGFLKGPQPPLTFTTAAFAQTKFGSTKLKSNSKRSHRMSPTEFSHYIKQRAMQQQQQQASATAAAMFAAAAAAASSSGSSAGTTSSPRPRSLSPCLDPSSPGFLLMGQPFAGQPGGGKPFDVFSNGYLGDLLAGKGGARQQSQGPPQQHRFSPYLEKTSGDVTPPGPSPATAGFAVPYPGGQHLLVAN